MIVAFRLCRMLGISESCEVDAVLFSEAARADGVAFGVMFLAEDDRVPVVMPSGDVSAAHQVMLAETTETIDSDGADGAGRQCFLKLAITPLDLASELEVRSLGALGLWLGIPVRKIGRCPERG